ncbi:MAG: enoyl-CoA hydratase-related protein [Bdellovibrionales bacterium]|jgi:enoyl-CoA hydratase|nr:enoyl-CoA hydratase-related protein [Bdellovibrionales bacterium]
MSLSPTELSLPELKNLELHREGAVLVATIARPEALNALNTDSIQSIGQLLDFVEQDEATRVLVLTGKGEKAFVAGADIKSFEAMSPDDAEAFARNGQKTFSRFEALSKPVIAAVNGFALGGGLELALACDLIIASEKAKFALPECKLGLIPGFGGTVRLPRRIGTAKALELALTGEMLTAADAAQCGLVVKVVPHGEALKASLELAQKMVQRAPKALAYIKKSVQLGRDKWVEEAHLFEATLFGEVFKTKDKAEGVRAFIEGREAKFTGA